MSVRRLGVWLDGVRVASLTARRQWDLRCRYEPDVIARGEANRPLLSCSLPVTNQSTNATPWVRGLLPEGQHLLALASRAGVPTNHYASMLERYGRDIAGSFAIGSQAPDPARWALAPYADDELASELRVVLDAPGFAVRDDSELSIAGLQNKLLVTALPDGRWARPVNGHPSTHIMKLADGRFDGLLAAEHACLQLARAVGLTTIAADLFEVGDIEVLTVERYDRLVDPDSGMVRRLHQEDSCQALACDIDAAQGRGKYERYGGPSFARIARLLDQYGDASIEHVKLLRAAIFTSAIGNNDAHGKNLSFLIDTTSGAVTLAPLYDTVPTALWSQLRSTTAMSINGRFDLPSRHDLIAEARRWGLGTSTAHRIVDEALAELRAALPVCDHDAVAELTARRLTAIETGSEPMSG